MTSYFKACGILEIVIFMASLLMPLKMSAMPANHLIFVAVYFYGNTVYYKKQQGTN